MLHGVLQYKNLIGEFVIPGSSDDSAARGLFTILAIALQEQLDCGKSEHRANNDPRSCGLLRVIQENPIFVFNDYLVSLFFSLELEDNRILSLSHSM